MDESQANSKPRLSAAEKNEEREIHNVNSQDSVHTCTDMMDLSSTPDKSQEDPSLIDSDGTDEHKIIAATASPTTEQSHSIIIFGEDTRVSSKSFIARCILHTLCRNKDGCELHTVDDEKCCVECSACKPSKHEPAGIFEVCVMNCQHSDTCVYLVSLGMMETHKHTPQLQPWTPLFDYLRRNVTNIVSLLLFTLPLGRFDTSGRLLITKVVQLLSNQAGNISALVVTGCEDLTMDAKDKCKQELMKNCETVHLINFMKQGIGTVGFPDLKNVRKEAVEIYGEQIKASQKELAKIVSIDIGKTNYLFGVEALINQTQSGDKHNFKWSVPSINCKIL